MRCFMWGKLIRSKKVWLVLMVVVGLVWWRQGVAAKKQEDEVRVASVARKDVVARISVGGKTVARKRAVLNFQLVGKLAYVGVKEGDRVVRGRVLMSLDAGDLVASERAAYYTYLAADANAKKVEDEVKGHESDETFTQKNSRVAAQTARDKAYDGWLVAQRAVRNVSLVAPFSGVVTEVTSVVVGDTVGVTDGVMIVDPGSVYFEVEVDESDLGRVKVGEVVSVKIDAYSEREFSGKVEEVGWVTKVSDTGATVVVVKVGMGKTGVEELRVGLNGDAEIEYGRAQGVLTLPIEAVNDGEVVTVDGKKVKVEVGLSDEKDIEIRSGLNEGDKLKVE